MPRLNIAIAAIRNCSSHYAKRVRQLINKKLAKSCNVELERPLLIPEPSPRDWSELPDDILCLISERLHSFKDQLRFLGVCKNWRQVSDRIRAHHKLPWLLLLKGWKVSQDPTHHTLYDPWSRETFLIENKNPRNCKFRLTTDVLALNSGWVLIRDGSDKGQIVIYSPFSQETVLLPRLAGLNNLRIPFTFTYCPNSRSFHVYGAYLEVRFNPVSILVVTWRSGDEDWKYHDFGLERWYRGGEKFDYCYIRSLMCFRGDLYCFFGSGLVGRFEFSGEKHWSVVAEAKELRGKLWLHDVVMCDGEIYLVSNKDYLLSRVRVFRLDLSNKVWVEESSLGERVLFCGPHGGFSAMLSVGKSKKDLAGRMYYRTDYESCHYRVDGGERVEGRDDGGTCAFGWPIEHLRSTNGSPILINPAVWIELPN